jgi:hypothetical protein
MLPRATSVVRECCRCPNVAFDPAEPFVVRDIAAADRKAHVRAYVKEHDSPKDGKNSLHILGQR